MKLIYCLIIMLWPYLSRAQQRPVEPIRVGEHAPDMAFKHLLNGTNAPGSLSSFDDKLVLLDFWATWCSACIKQFPKLDSLQTHFKDRLQVILVSNSASDNRAEILRFFDKHLNPSGKKYAFPVVTNDVQLTGFFPHLSLPHVVWIYGGRVIAITDAEEVSAANMERVLQGQKVNLDQKEDNMDFDPSSTLLAGRNGGNESALLHRSLFTRYLKGLGSPAGLSVEADSTLLRLYVVNQPVLKLYALATPDLPANRVLLEVTDTDKLVHEAGDKQWRQANFYSYELTVPVSTSITAMHAMMREDIDRQFGLHSLIGEREIHCYALVRTGIVGLFPGKNKSSGTLSALQATNDQPGSVLIRALNYQVPGKPLRPIVLDETGYTGPLNLEVPPQELRDISAMKKSLQPYGLDIIPVTRKVAMLIISPATSIYSSPN